MRAVRAVPASGEAFLDPRDPDRALRVSWHDDAGVVVLSLWRGGVCAGTFRLPVEEVPTMIEALRSGLGRAYDHSRTATAVREPLPSTGARRALPPLPEVG